MITLLVDYFSHIFENSSIKSRISKATEKLRTPLQILSHVRNRKSIKNRETELARKKQESEDGAKGRERAEINVEASSP